MKNYAVLEGMKRHQKTVLDDAFNKGYDQGYQDGKLDGEAENIEKLEKSLDAKKEAEYDRGYKEGKEAAEDDMCKYYNKHFNDVVHSSNDDAYQRGYEDGRNEILTIKVFEEYYQKGLKHGQELRAKEAECAEACGMKRAWQAVRKIMYMSLFDLNELFPGWDVEHIIEKLSAKEVIEKVEAWEKKQKQTEKNCDNCKYNNREKTSYPCAACLRKVDGRHAMWEEKEDYVRDATPEESKSVNDYIKSISEETGVTFEEKKEQAEKSCKTCKFNPPEKKWPCVDCDVSIHDRYEPKQDVTEMNVDTIEVWDEVKDNFGNKLLVTQVYNECRNVDTINTDGRFKRFPSECLKKTGRRYQQGKGW